MWRNVHVTNWNCRQRENNVEECDPIEVRFLKKQLAQISCKNIVPKHPYSLFETTPGSCEQGVQVKYEPKKADQNTQATSDQEKSDCIKFHSHTVSICPSCLVAFGALQGGVTKVMKDEELETDFGTMNREKSAGVNVECVSKTTSVTSHPYSTYGLYEYSSECLGDEVYRNRSPKRSNHEVTFLDDYFDNSLPENGMPSTNSQDCVCADTFIDSIRPPMK